MVFTALGHRWLRPRRKIIKDSGMLLIPFKVVFFLLLERRILYWSHIVYGEQ